MEIQTGGTVSSPVTGFKLVDGNQTDKYVLTTDSNGVATWKPIKISRIVGTLGGGVNIPFTSYSTSFLNTGSRIALPPGTWQVDVRMLLPVTIGTLTANDWIWLKTTFSETNTSTITESSVTADIVGTTYLVSGLFSGPKASSATPAKYNMLSGSLIIRNSSSANKTYYYYAGFTENREYSTGSGKATQFNSFGGTSWGEDIITATPIY